MRSTDKLLWLLAAIGFAGMIYSCVSYEDPDSPPAERQLAVCRVDSHRVKAELERCQIKLQACKVPPITDTIGTVSGTVDPTVVDTTAEQWKLEQWKPKWEPEITTPASPE